MHSLNSSREGTEPPRRALRKKESSLGPKEQALPQKPPMTK